MKHLFKKTKHYSKGGETDPFLPEKDKMAIQVSIKGRVSNVVQLSEELDIILNILRTKTDKDFDDTVIIDGKLFTQAYTVEI